MCLLKEAGFAQLFVGSVVKHTTENMLLFILLYLQAGDIMCHMVAWLQSPA